ncbi:hypothetical protein RMSM_07328 [Rhodopirellula maiorica SM1]|uniref:DUF4235 domain-containing protein n=1 Tax=Rhodopirellula maiorica SM1 TaxID=1265738 RepID=M5RK61_9BACT|nr:DUF4235 domain-containing protein [Rhodopirellula maiorica]EMI15757.1 hypothetical protein RMSM_07328 [Rhodopirellula maiorica SM1]
MSSTIETMHERYDDLRNKVDEYTGRDEPDGRNPGIGRTESTIALAAAIAGTFVARHLLEAAWKSTLDRDPPKNPASREVAWREALLWGAASGAVVGIARIASRRATSGAYRNWRS